MKVRKEGQRLKTLIAVPCLDMVHTSFVRSFIGMAKTEDCHYTFVQNSLIYNARNIIAQNAIAEGFERVLWLDSDITFEPDTLLKLSADMDQGIDYVSGLYFMRATPTKPVIYSDVWWKVGEGGWVDTGKKNFYEYPKESLFPIAGSGFGCVMTSVELLKKVVGQYGSPFTPMMGIGEDLAFCWRVGQMGLKMYCDSRIKCGHIGQTEYTEKTFAEGMKEWK